MEAEQQTCPRRMSDWGPWERAENLDTWTTGHGVTGQDRVGLSCSFCGSLHPDKFMELVRDSWVVGPTDKNYKAYLGRAAADNDHAGAEACSQEAKFYYQHLSAEQRAEFIELHNAGRMRIGYPGHLYTLPFFAGRGPTPAG